MEEDEEKNEEKTAEDYYKEANEQYEKGEFEKAILLYNEAIRRDPMHKYFYNRGLSYACLERYEEAQEDIRKVIQLRPNFEEGWYILGLTREYLHDPDGAIEMYKKALQINPDFKDAQNRKELVESKKVRPNTGPLSKTRSSKRDSYEYATTLEEAKGKEKRGELEEALEIIEEKLKQDPDDFRLLLSQQLLKAKIEASSKPEIICGLDEAKDEIDTYAISPLASHNPLYEAQIAQSSKGILLHGPPGGGKNHLTINLAKAAGIEIIEVALHEILNMWSGESEKRLKMLFNSAKENAANGKPTMIFVNEIDALGLARDMATQTGESSWSRDLRNTFRMLIDDIQKIPNLIIVGATNYIWSVDDALKRPGRFGGCIIYVGPPDEKTREKLFKHYSRETPGHENLNLKRLARMTPWFTPDDIRDICRKVHLQLPKKNNENETARTKDYEKLIKTRFPVALTWLRKAAKAWTNGQIEETIDERLLDDICQIDPAAKAKREALERELEDAKEMTKRGKRRTKHQTAEYIS